MGLSRLYMIRRGQHYSDGSQVRPFLGRMSVRFKAVFGEHCIYVPQQVPGQINKLFGLAWGAHHVCSGRIGWRSDGVGIELFSYVYVGKDERRTRSFGVFGAGVVQEYVIARRGSQLLVEMVGVGRHVYMLERPKWWGYWLFPYFGGAEAAPHTMGIEVEVIEKK